MKAFCQALILSSLLISCQARSSVRLFNLFQSNMVLQRDKPCPIWGRAESGEAIILQFRNQSFQTKAGAEGRWKITLPPQPAGGPFIIKVIGGGNTVTLSNVLFGDVWICGGQSNMQMRVRKTGYAVDSAKDNNPAIRCFTVAVATDFVPLDTLGGGEWEVASPASVPEFSATPYFFARQLQETLHVPIGLINNNLGTSIETWMSAEAIHQLPQFADYYNAWLAPRKGFAAFSEAFEKTRPEWERKYYLKGDPGLEQQWYLPGTDVSGWKTMEIPGYWEDRGLPDYDGSVWFRRSFDLPADYAHGGARINLGEVDDYHTAWVNGHKVGETFGNQVYTTYPVPDSILKPAGNVLVVRVFDAGGKGGMHDMMWHQELAGAWLYKPGVRIRASEFKRPALANVSLYSAPSLLYNGSIAPLTPLAIKGVIWYQGESNAPRGEEYGELFPAMIKDWRKQFGQGDFPFLFVQLANYGAEPAQPGPSDWAELRESQTAALALPNTAMTVAIDIGEATDLHPKAKPELGKRMGFTALKHFYGAKMVDLSPEYDHMQPHGDSIILFFKAVTTNPLISNDKYGYLRGFAIAGADQKFYWAKAAIVGRNAVVVYSETVKRPVAVRYGWADNPGQLDLHNSAGWPAAPFRTDDWPGNTAGKRFELKGE